MMFKALFAVAVAVAAVALAVTPASAETDCDQTNVCPILGEYMAKDLQHGTFFDPFLKGS